MAQLRKAQRQKAKIRLGLASPSGGGKTYSALLIAKGLVGSWDKVAIIDTENFSADLYSHLGDFNVLSIEAPYSPSKYIDAIKTCEDAGMECIIIDSITHEWSGVGGCLELQQIETDKQRNRNSYTAWRNITPLHQKFVDSILQSKCHIITTVRNKTDYIQETVDGRTSIKKAGTAQVTRDGFEYELTVSLELDTNHYASVSKDRTNLFEGKPVFKPSEETGRIIKEWCESGQDKRTEVFKAIAEATTTSDIDKIAEDYAMLKIVNQSGKMVFPDEIKKALRAKYEELKK